MDLRRDGGRFQSPERPLPWEPLGEWLKGYFADELSEFAMARALHVSRDTLRRWKAKGLTLDEGDRLATKVLDEHLSAIWRDYWDESRDL